MDDGELVLGIDGGGTRTRAVCCDRAGRVLGLGAGGPANARGRDPEAVRSSIRTAVSAALDGRRGALAAVRVGLAGVWTKAERVQARDTLLPSELRACAQVSSDLEIAHAGAFGAESGVLLVAGTGAACLGRDAAGRIARAGGWGPHIDDSGGAHELVRAALRAAARAVDGRGPASVLAERLCVALGASDLRGALRALEGPAGERDALAGLAPLVTTAASEGDEVAWSLVARAAVELARSAAATARALALESPRIAAVGGLASDAGLSAALDAALAAEIPGARRVAARLPPVLGACLVALESAGRPAGDVLEALKRGSALLTGP